MNITMSDARAPHLHCIFLQATEKTSQALREGQKDIRKKMYQSDDAVLAYSAASAETNQASNTTMPPEPDLLGNNLPPVR